MIKSFIILTTAIVVIVSGFVLPGVIVAHYESDRSVEMVSEFDVQNSAIHKVAEYISSRVFWEGDEFYSYDLEYASIIAREIVNSDFPLLMLAIIEVESRFDNMAINSRSGAYGLGQIHPIHESELIKAGVVSEFSKLADPRKNITAACFVLDQKLKLANGDLDQALLLYSGGLSSYPQMIRSKMEKFEKWLTS